MALCDKSHYFSTLYCCIFEAMSILTAKKSSNMKSNIVNPEAYQKAKKRLVAKRAFKSHLFVYLAVCGVLLVINLLTFPAYLWAKWPAMGWGIAIIFHAMTVYSFLGAPPITDEMIEDEMNKNP